MLNNKRADPKYELILLDADGTLFDYDAAEAEALSRAFNRTCLVFEYVIHEKYRAINSKLWKDFENGRISKADLQTRRFALLLDSCSIQADACELNKVYLDYMAECGHLMEDAQETCRTLSKFCTLAIVTNGVARTQKGRLKNSLVRPYIKYIIVSEEAGFQKPHQGFFQYAMDVCGVFEKNKILIVGDSLNADIKGGLDFGITTCWYNPKKLQESCPKADYEIVRLHDLIQIVL